MADPLRVVIDPNVLVSATLTSGSPRRVVDLVRVGAVQMISCPQLHAELEGVLARERFLRWRTREQLDRYAADLRTMAHQVSDPVDVPSVTRDPGDDYLVALTALVRADVLCSGDADLTQLSDVPVLSPRALLDLVRSRESGSP